MTPRAVAPLALRLRLAARQLPRVGRSWAAWACAIVLAVPFAIAGRTLATGPERYPDLIVGWIAWSAAGKSADYRLLGFFAIGSPAVLIGIAALRASLLHGCGRALADRFDRMLAVACLPAAMWAGGQLFNRSFSLALLALAGAACLLVLLLFAGLAARRRTFRPIDPDAAQDVCGGALAIGLAAGFAVLGAALVADRLNLALHWRLLLVRPRSLDQGYLVALGLALLLTATAFRRAPDLRTLQRWLRTLLLVAQVPLAGLYLVLQPIATGQTGTMALDLLVLLLAAAILADLVRRWRGGAGAGVLSALSPLSLIAILLMLKTDIGVAHWALPEDDYHFGEFLVPWWSLAEHHLIPYWDFSPARGLLANYLPGLLSATFLGGTASDLLNVWPLQYLAVLLIVLPLLARVVGREIAFLLLLLAPAADGLAEIDLANTAVLAVLCRAYPRWRPTQWLVGYGLASLLAILMAPGQGALVALALSPLAMASAWRGWHDERRRMAWAAGALAAALLAIGLATPLGRMAIGAFRYGVEQAAANSVANGIPWSASLAGNGAVAGNPWLWEAARAAWILAPAIAGLLALAALAARPGPRRATTIAFALPILLLALLFILRAAGRIDTGTPSRLGLATIWFWALLVPMLLVVALDARHRVGALALCAGFASLMPLSGRSDLGALILAPATLATLSAGSDGGPAPGLPRLGNAPASQAQLDRLAGLRRVLDRQLGAGETYLDMTNRGADYFYLDRPPPIEVAAFYNLIGADQQSRAVRAVAAAGVPLVLIDAQNILHDGGPASLRAPLLYRYVVLNDAPVRAGGATWLVRPDRLASMGHAEQPGGRVDEDGMRLLDRAFRVPDLKGIPAAWGGSAGSLAARMVPIAALRAVATSSGVRQRGDGRFEVTGGDPSVTYEAAQEPLDGRDAGLLGFDFKCQAGAEPAVLTVAWATRSRPAGEATTVRFDGADGRLIVPLDAAPRWLLAEDIAQIRIGLANPAACTAFELDHVALFQRAAAAALDGRRSAAPQ